MADTIAVRGVSGREADSIWRIMEPIVRAGNTYPLRTNLTREEALAYWNARNHDVFVAEADGRVVGTYYLRRNQEGGGAHVANCGFMTAEDAIGRGVGRGMCQHSLQRARERGFMAMQFNFVVSTNVAAVHLWQSCGFHIVGRLPSAFRHPSLGLVDALIMHRHL